MRLDKIVLIGVFLIFNSPFCSFAELILKNFSSGEYELTKGKEDLCVPGEFKLFDDEGPKMSMGSMHAFSLVNKKSRIADNLDDSAACFYNVEDKVETVKNITFLSFRETYKCKAATQYILTKNSDIFSVIDFFQFLVLFFSRS